jgi:hypothetical protein
MWLHRWEPKRWLFGRLPDLGENACTPAFSVLARIVRERMLRAGARAGVAGRPLLCEVPPGAIAPQAEREAGVSPLRERNLLARGAGSGRS